MGQARISRPLLSDGAASTLPWASNLPAGLGLEVDLGFEVPFVGDGNWADETETWLIAGDGGRALLDPLCVSEYGPYGLQTTYPGNHYNNGDGGLTIEGRTLVARQMYMCMELFVDPDYEMHPNDEKFDYPLTDNGEGSMTGFTIGGPGGHTHDGPTFALDLDTQLTGSTRLYQTEAVWLTKGEVQRVELYKCMNTPGEADGIWRAWRNGVLMTNRTDIMYSAALSQASWIGWRLTGTRGGGLAEYPTPAGGQKRQYPRLTQYVSPSLP